MKLPLPKLLKWLVRRFLISFSVFLFFGIAGLYIFFEGRGGLGLIFIFLLGAFFSSLIFIFLSIQILHSLARAVAKAQNINKGAEPVSGGQEPYLDEEPGEFYELNKSLSQINSYLKRQRRIISQESSELETVISALTEAILAVDQNKKALFFNNQAALLFSPQRKLKKPELALSEMIRAPDVLQAYDECLQKGRAVKSFVSMGVLGTNEEPRDYEITVAPLKNPDNKVQGAVGLFYDISDIKKTEKIQLDFITNVSHELRTPLTAIQGYVETLMEMDTGAKEQIKRFLTVIHRNVQRLVSLLNHFLDLSQMEGRKALKKEELSAEKITKSIAQDLHIKNHKLEMSFLHKTVKADRHFLKQILYNLIDNAVKYAPAGRLIEILWEKKGSHVVLTVKDQGKGISDQHKSRLFERFYRADPSRRSAKGVGIGLFIVKQLMEKHGGAIKVKSAPGKGSAFICSFPDD